MQKIDRVKPPILADGQYTEWVFKMVESINKNTGNPDIGNEWHTLRLLTNLVDSELDYSKVYEVFSTTNYTTDENRFEMEEALIMFEQKMGRFLLALVQLIMKMGITPADIKTYYDNLIKDNDLTVLSGGKEPLNLALQVGHWENYIVSEVGWSLRGAFHIVPPAEVAENSLRAYVGNKISNDSIYVMRIKQYDITVKLMELFSESSEAKRNIKAMELWMAVFNYLNYLDAKPIKLWGIILNEYNYIIDLMEKHADNK